jgi:hypothetical protein
MEENSDFQFDTGLTVEDVLRANLTNTSVRESGEPTQDIRSVESYPINTEDFIDEPNRRSEYHLDSDLDIDMSPKPTKSIDNKEWMKTVYAGTTNHKYSGRLSSSTTDLKKEVVNLKYLVDELIQFAGVPDDEYHHGFVARCFLEGPILDTVIASAAELKRSLTKAEIFRIVDNGVEGSTPGVITLAERFNELSAHKVAVALSKKSDGPPDLSQIVQELKRHVAERERVCPMGWLDKILMWLHMFRGPDPELKQIRKKARKHHDANGIPVEQKDPDLMLSTICNCNDIWQTYWSRKKREYDSRTRSYHEDKRNANGKRPFSSLPPNSSTPSKAASGKPTASLDPFKVPGKAKLSMTPTETCKRLWIRGMTKDKKDKLMSKQLCMLCEQKGHRIDKCKEREKAFSDGRFCFRPEIE